MPFPRLAAQLLLKELVCMENILNRITALRPGSMHSRGKVSISKESRPFWREMIGYEHKKERERIKLWMNDSWKHRKQNVSPFMVGKFVATRTMKEGSLFTYFRFCHRPPAAFSDLCSPLSTSTKNKDGILNYISIDQHYVCLRRTA